MQLSLLSVPLGPVTVRLLVRLPRRLIPTLFLVKLRRTFSKVALVNWPIALTYVSLLTNSINLLNVVPSSVKLIMLLIKVLLLVKSSSSFINVALFVNSIS